MTNARRKFTAEQKAAIVGRHLKGNRNAASARGSAICLRKLQSECHLASARG
jgi:hypothetical protein